LARKDASSAQSSVQVMAWPKSRGSAWREDGISPLSHQGVISTTTASIGSSRSYWLAAASSAGPSGVLATTAPSQK